MIKEAVLFGTAWASRAFMQIFFALYN